METLGRDITTIRIGGIIDRFEEPKSEAELLQLLKDTEGPLKAYGGGSNLIFSDEGFRGTVIRPLLSDIAEVPVSMYLPEFEVWQRSRVASGRYDGNAMYNVADVSAEEIVLLEAGSGVIWAALVAFCIRNNLEGLETFARIPCRVGGAIRNNIHAGSELIGSRVVMVRSVTKDGNVNIYLQKDLEFGYDTSRFILKPEIVTKVVFALKRVSPERSAENAARYRDIISKKTITQPNGANCGSVFQNLVPNGDHPVAAAWYIEQAGCKGLEVGKLCVSKLHANFIVNTGDGLQSDFVQLVHRVQQRVQDFSGVSLIPEAEVIDQWGRSVWT